MTARRRKPTKRRSLDLPHKPPIQRVRLGVAIVAWGMGPTLCVEARGRQTFYRMTRRQVMELARTINSGIWD